MSETYYHSSSNIAPVFSELIDRHIADVCVIGGGLTGVSTALNLAEKGFSVILLEAHQIGSGASGRNGGQIVNGFSCDMDVISKTLGRQRATILWDLALEAIEEIDRRINMHHILCERKSGYIFAATNTSQMRDLHRIHGKLRNFYNYNKTVLLDQKALKKWVKTDRYAGGLLDYGSGHFHSLNYLYGLTKAANDIGVQIFENSEITKIVRGNELIVNTNFGSVKAKTLVLAGNAYLEGLENTSQQKIIRITSTVGVTTPLSIEQINDILPGATAVADCNNILDYFRITGDQRLLFGAGADYLGRETKNKKQFIRDHILKLFPQLNNINLEFAWDGYIAGTINQLPEIKQLQSNIYIAHGFSGHGLALTGLAGMLISEKISGNSKRFDLFAEISHHNMPQSIIRNPFLMAAMLFKKLKDLYL
jgi:gamma-glutamylputrescine oxidase